MARTHSPRGGRVRILLVDDHELARHGLRSMLSTADWIEVVGEAADCRSALELAEQLRPAIVLLDIRMPDESGLQCLPRMRRVASDTAVVMVTSHDDRAYVVEAIRLGAAGYLLKDASSGELLDTISQVTDGQLAIDPELLREALTAVTEDAVEEDIDLREQYSLTAREYDVLALVAEGLTNKEIGARLGIAEDTAKKHVQNLIWKLHAADRTQAAVIALRSGLLEQRR